MVLKEASTHPGPLHLAPFVFIFEATLSRLDFDSPVPTMSETHEHTNRLADETSPYLLQHAHNPVDWHPWDEQALETAREEDKPIFLSIGYSACHWCHVMERESFEDESIAAYLNEHFVPIKVDREERPDLDQLYMKATQMITGQGGWPMSVFLTPDLEPFYAGTYFPPEDKWGRPGFETVLENVVDLWENKRGRVDEIGGEITDKIQRSVEAGGPDTELSREPLGDLFVSLDGQFDEVHGGFGGEPKFPPSMKLRALMKIAAADEVDDEQGRRIAEMVETTLVRMASGGMYDQIGGGFHRYSTDKRWLVPHFEKMLYDNALLGLAYADAHRSTGREFYARILRETLDYVEREMTFDYDDEAQPFYSTQDAESEGEEGKYFVWTPESLREVLDDDEAERAGDYWDVTESGNFEHGWSIPNRLHALDEEGLEEAFEYRPDDVEEIQRTLFDARQDRVPPDTDTKVIAAWNGLMIQTFARAGFVLGNEDYVESARHAAEFVLSEMVEKASRSLKTGDFELMRTYKGERARFTGYLDDYAFMATGLVELFEATGERKWLWRAERLVDRMIELFGDDEEGGFYYTGEHHEHLLARDKDQLDNSIPSGNSMAVEALWRIGELRGRDDLRDRADAVLRAFFPQLERQPQAMGQMLQGLDAHLSDPLEILIVAPEGTEPTPLEDVVRRTWVPHAVRVTADLGEANLEEWTEAVPLLEGRGPLDGDPTAFVCRRGTCQRPTTDPGELEGLLS
jgi:uncharacterized protein YyaL (SSP411 family)